MSSYIRIADIEIDPTQLDAYTAAISEEIEASVRTEPGVLALYAVSNQERPGHVIVFEIYADEDAYRAHLLTPHFLKYKLTTQTMVRSLTLREAIPLALGAKTVLSK